MDIQLLLASTPGQGSAPGGKPGPEARAAFSQELARAGQAGNGPQVLASRGQPLGGSERPAPEAPAAGEAPLLARASLGVMMQALGEEGLAEGGDFDLAEIAERLALIDDAGRGEAPLAAADLEALARGAEALAARRGETPMSAADLKALETLPAPSDTPPAAVAGDPPEARLADAESWPTLAMAGQALPNAAGREAGPGELPPARAERGRAPEGELPWRAMQAERAAPGGPEPLRAAGEGRLAPPVQPAETMPAALASRGDAPPVAAEPRGEGFAALLNGQSAGAGTSTTPAAAQASLPAPLASPAWPQQFSQQVGQQLVMLGQRGGEQRVELHLNPAELGPLTVSLKVGEQAAQAQFLSAHAPVRSAVEQAIPQLREALAEQGISLGETSVGEQRRDDAPRDFAGRAAPGAGGGSDPGDELDGLGEAATPSAADLSLDGRVDLYA
ncbi:flagellar hook-length control protein FliK [Halomonas sp. C05BenzN]|uniref:flagellar hook-length control protein FliK n=1 Tax=Halomonas sp. C05BenzN TaxID=3411041 RepID=UPI003B964850